MYINFMHNKFPQIWFNTVIFVNNRDIQFHNYCLRQFSISLNGWASSWSVTGARVNTSYNA